MRFEVPDDVSDIMSDESAMDIDGESYNNFSVCSDPDAPIHLSARTTRSPPRDQPMLYPVPDSTGKRKRDEQHYATRDLENNIFIDPAAPPTFDQESRVRRITGMITTTLYAAASAIFIFFYSYFPGRAEQSIAALETDASGRKRRAVDDNATSRPSPSKSSPLRSAPIRAVRKSPSPPRTQQPSPPPSSDDHHHQSPRLTKNVNPYKRESKQKWWQAPTDRPTSLLPDMPDVVTNLTSPWLTSDPENSANYRDAISETQHRANLAQQAAWEEWSDQKDQMLLAEEACFWMKEEDKDEMRQNAIRASMRKAIDDPTCPDAECDELYIHHVVGHGQGLCGKSANPLLPRLHDWAIQACHNTAQMLAEEVAEYEEDFEKNRAQDDHIRLQQLKIAQEAKEKRDAQKASEMTYTKEIHDMTYEEQAEAAIQKRSDADAKKIKQMRRQGIAVTAKTMRTTRLVKSQSPEPEAAQSTQTKTNNNHAGQTDPTSDSSRPTTSSSLKSNGYSQWGLSRSPLAPGPGVEEDSSWSYNKTAMPGKSALKRTRKPKPHTRQNGAGADENAEVIQSLTWLSPEDKRVRDWVAYKQEKYELERGPRPIVEDPKKVRAREMAMKEQERLAAKETKSRADQQGPIYESGITATNRAPQYISPQNDAANDEEIAAAVENVRLAELARTTREEAEEKQKEEERARKSAELAREAEEEARKAAEEEKARKAVEEAKAKKLAEEREARESAEKEAKELAEAEAEWTKKQKMIRPLDPKYEDMVAKAMGKHTQAVLANAIDGSELRRHDFGSLIPQSGTSDDQSGWLNDNIVNAWFAAIVDRKLERDGYVKGANSVPSYVAFNSGWYNTQKAKGIAGIKGWSRRKGIMGEKMLKAEKIFFPINTGSHWLLLIIHPKQRKIELLDSLRRKSSGQFWKIARDWIKQELGDAYDEAEWTESSERSNLQSNIDDCGVFTAMNGLAAAKGYPFDAVVASGMKDARRTMAAVLLAGGLRGDWEL